MNKNLFHLGLLILAGLIALANVVGYIEETPSAHAQAVSPLPGFVSTSTPTAGITQRIFGAKIILSGLASGNCLTLDSNLVLTTTACGSGGSSGLSTTSPWTAGQVAYVTSSGTVSSVATTTFTPSAEFTIGGTIGRFIGGANSTLALATNGIGLTKLTTIAANTILGNNTGATGNVVAFATSTLGIALSDTNGTLTVSRGGTGDTTFTSGQILYGNLTNALSSVGTSSLALGTGLNLSAGTLGYQIGGTNATIKLADTAVTPGSYTNLNATIDQQGRITLASNGSAGGSSGLGTTSPTSSSNLLYYNATGAGSAQGVATSTLTGTGVISISNSPVIIGASGAVISCSTCLTANQTITLSGDVSGSGTTAITTTIGANKVTLPDIAQIAANTILGNQTGGTANVVALATSTLSIGGNAGTATALQTARTINGVSFNGTANIVVASTTLLSDFNTFSNLQQFNGGASTTQLSASGQIFANQGAAGVPGYSFTGNPTYGITMSGSSIEFSNAGAFTFFVAGSGLGTILSTGPVMQNSTGATLTAPVFVPDRASATTGFAAGVVGNIDAIVTGAEVSRWTSTGFGVGTSTPFSTLSVSTTTQSAPTTSLFAVASTTNATLFNVLGGGNVGIGTTSPGTLLSIQGIANFTAATTTYQSTGGIDLRGGGCYAINGTCLSSGSSLTGTIGQTAYFTGTNVAAGTSTLLFGTNSHVGVGTSTPFSDLTILDTGTSTSPFSVWGGVTRTHTVTQTFTSTGTWTKPAGFVSAVITAVGGGGGGGAARSGNGFGSGSGGGSTKFAAATACVAAGGGGGAEGTSGGGGAHGNGGGTRTGGTWVAGSASGGGGGGGGDKVVCTYDSTVGSSITVSIGKGGTVDGSTNNGGTGFTAGGNSIFAAGGTGGGAGAGSTGAGGNNSSATGGVAGTGNSSGGTVTNGSNGSDHSGTTGGNGGASGDGTAGALAPGGFGTSGAGGAGNTNTSGIGGGGGDGYLTIVATVTDLGPYSALTITPIQNSWGDTNQYVGIGTTTPMATLAVQAASSSPIFAAGHSRITDMNGTTAATTDFLIDQYGHLFSPSTPVPVSGNVTLCINATTGAIFQGGSGTSCAPSSELFKTDIASSTVGLDELMQLDPVSFFFKTGDTQQNLGFIAQEVKLIDPRLVEENSDGTPRALRLDNFIAVLVRSVQDLKGHDDVQDQEIAALQAKVEALQHQCIAPSP